MLGFLALGALAAAGTIIGSAITSSNANARHREQLAKEEKRHKQELERRKKRQRDNKEKEL